MDTTILNIFNVFAKSEYVMPQDLVILILMYKLNTMSASMHQKLRMRIWIAATFMIPKLGEQIVKYSLNEILYINVKQRIAACKGK